MNDVMHDWMHELSLVAEAEFHARRVVATLATVDRQGNPRARTVFVRALDKQARTLWITTDARSSKVDHLRARPVAELVIWAPHERQQFRLRGTVQLVSSGRLREEMWAEMSDAARALYFMPAPGSPRRPDDAIPAAGPADTAAPPPNFVLLALRPTEVESLELNESPHRRWLWRESTGWQPELIHP